MQPTSGSVTSSNRPPFVWSQPATWIRVRWRCSPITRPNSLFWKRSKGSHRALTPSSAAVPAGIQPGELLTEADGYGWAYVNAAFCHPGPTGNRFNGPERGAWYASYGNNAAETAKAEVAWHLTRELRATGVYENITTYRELLAGFMSRFHDLGERSGEAVFSEDTAEAYPAGPTLARDILARRRERRVLPVRPLRGREDVWRRYGPIWCRTSARAKPGCSGGRGRWRWRYRGWEHYDGPSATLWSPVVPEWPEARG